VRSALDGQMRAVDITDLARQGVNVVALRLTVTNATDGLLDLLKITGAFSLTRRSDGGYGIAAPRRTVQPASWTAQGYPYYSGRGVYRRAVQVPPDFVAGRRVFLEAAMADDVLEVA